MRATALLLALLILIGGAAYYFGAVDPVTTHVKQGLDLQGGILMVLEAYDTEEVQVTSRAMDAAVEIIRTRVDVLGVSEPLIQREGERRIIVELAGTADPEEARQTLGRTVMLRFIDPEGNTVITGRHLERAGVNPPGTGGSRGAAVTLQLNAEGTRLFAEATSKWIGQPIAIVLDDEIISAPYVESVIGTGNAQITGNFTTQEAARLAGVLNGGALPVALQTVEVRQVSATLGQSSLHKSLYAGLIGFALVALFMLVYYRVPGLLAIAALVAYLGLLFAALIGLNAVLTLPGLAGIVLSVGMAVDANVLIFERIKEELRAGKGLRTGIKSGFHRAFGTVLDANVTTLLAAAILYYLGTGPVKGFALTLAIGILASMLTAITLTRGFLALSVATGLFNKRTLFGVREA